MSLPTTFLLVPTDRLSFSLPLCHFSVAGNYHQREETLRKRKEERGRKRKKKEKKKKKKKKRRREKKVRRRKKNNFLNFTLETNKRKEKIFALLVCSFQYISLQQLYLSVS